MADILKWDYDGPALGEVVVALDGAETAVGTDAREYVLPEDLPAGPHVVQVITRNRSGEAMSDEVPYVVTPPLQPPNPATNVRIELGGIEEPPPGAKVVLRQGDFTYLGAFELPAVQGYTTGAVRGFTHRRVGTDELRFFASYQRDPASDGYHTIEVVAPALANTPAQWPAAVVLRNWGSIGAGTAGGGSVHGLYWDEPDQRLYYSGGDTYTPEGSFPSLGYVTIESEALVNHGPWFFTDRAKMAMGGVLAIPSTWARRNAPGHRLAAGFGGYFSLVASGPASIGPALTAFNPSRLDVLPTGESLPNVPLLGYPFNASPYSDPQRAHRDTDYQNDFDGWNPRDGMGYWTWTDWLAQGGSWIETTTKSGVVFFPTLSNGRTWYEGSTLHAEAASHSWFVYSPGHLEQVALGQKAEWQIQPTSFWKVELPGLVYPLPGWADYPDKMIAGTSYDETTRTLFVCVKFGRSDRAWPTLNPAVVHAYRVAE